jgi:hypothetical protein
MSDVRCHVCNPFAQNFLTDAACLTPIGTIAAQAPMRHVLPLFAGRMTLLNLVEPHRINEGLVAYDP